MDLTMKLEEELRSVIPVGTYIDLSKVPELYKTRFGVKLDQQPGAKKLSTLMKDMTHIFETTQKRSENNNSVVIYSVTQLSSVPTGKVSKIAAPSTPVLTAAVSQVTAAITAARSPLQLSQTHVTNVRHVAAAKAVVPVHLNDRSEKTVGLSEITASLHSAIQTVPRGDLASFVFATKPQQAAELKSSLITETTLNAVDVGSSFLGVSLEQDDEGVIRRSVYLNTNEPFCAICIGIQGAGKSHTMNVVLESCLLGTVQAESRSIISTTSPMCGLVLHYDQSQSNVCEAVGLNKHAARLVQFPELRVQRLVVLVSPTYYLQRKAFYGSHCEVIPLLFDWDSLTATQLKKLMRLSDTDAQLYVSVILNKLREYQRKNKIPSFDGFLKEVTELCNVNGQSGPLTQRLELLKSVVRESEPNKDLKGVGCNLTSLLKAGTLVVCDLTDPMMSADEACGVFQVLLEQFRSHPLGDVGKVVTFDEAHKYLNKSGPGCVELSNAIVDTVRLMRHEGIRVLISTQSPLTMPPELLELASVTILHKFQSADWAKYLGSKVSLPPGGFDEIQSLQQGQALLLSTQIDVSERGDSQHEERASVVNHLKVSIRPRLTLDLGASRRNHNGAASDYIEQFDELSLGDSEDDY